jgi:hypothetical protein
MYLSRYLARRGRLDKSERELGKVGSQALMATLDEIRPHRIAQKSRVILESPRAHMLSQYLCGTETPDSAHIIHEIQIRDKDIKMHRVRALIHCGATSIFMAPRLLKKLGISHEAAHITALGLGGQIMQHAKDSRKTSITVQYMEHLAPVTEPEVLVVPMGAYVIVPGLPWFRARIPEIVWNLRRLTALRSPNSPQAADKLSGEDKPPPEAHEKLSERDEDRPAPDVELLGATSFDDLLAGEEVVEAFALRIRECAGLMGATLEITALSGEKPRRWTRRAGSSGGSCGRWGSTWES